MQPWSQDLHNLHSYTHTLGNCPPTDSQETQPLPSVHSLEDDAHSAYLRDKVKWLMLPISKILNRSLKAIAA